MNDDQAFHLAMRSAGQGCPSPSAGDRAIGINGSVILHKPSWSSAEGPSGCFDSVPPNVSVLPLDDRGEEFLARPTGYTYRNRHGMQFKVFRYSTFGFRHCPARSDSGRELELYHGNRPPTSVLPVVTHLNPSDRLEKLYRDVTAASPKRLIIADAAGLSERSRQIMEGLCSACWREDPSLMFVIVDSNVCREDVMAHELMHIWLDLVEGYEDHRRYRDVTNGRSSFGVISVQSFVIDCKVQEKLKERGFPLRKSTDDIVEPLFDCAASLEAGIDLANRSQEAVMARLLARPGAVAELYDFTGEDREKIRYARGVFERHVPDIVRLADSFAEAFGQHGYTTRPEALRLIDECLRLHFAYLGKRLDFEHDFRIEHDAIERCDQFSPAPPGVPRGVNPDTLRRLVREGRFGGTRAVSGWRGAAHPHTPSVPLPGHAAGNVALLNGNRPGAPGGGPPFGSPQHRGVAPHARGPITHGANGLPLGTVPGTVPLTASSVPTLPTAGPKARYQPPAPGRQSDPMEGPRLAVHTLAGPQGMRPTSGGSGPPSAPGTRLGTGGPPHPGRPKRP